MFVFILEDMSELVWGIKNGDLEQVKDIIEKKVAFLSSESVKTCTSPYLDRYFFVLCFFLGF